MNRIKVGIIISFWLTGIATTSSANWPQSDGINTETAFIGEALARIADRFDYRSIKASTREPDEWVKTGPAGFLISYDYYTLFSRDPKTILDLGSMHRGVSSKRIDIQVILYKDAEIAAKQVARWKAKELDNIGAEVIRSDEKSVQIMKAWGHSLALRHGTKIIILDTRDQKETMQAIGDRLNRESW